MAIYLVRHGQDEDNANGILNGHRNMPLTKLGQEQAKEAAENLKDKNIDVIYSSPLKRTFETASIIAKELNINHVIPYPDLIERDFGDLTGKHLDDIPTLAKKTLQTDRILYFTEAENAENFPTLLKRAKGVLRDIKEKNPNQNVLLVTHGDTGKMLQASAKNMTWEEGLRTPFINNCDVLEL